jgi:hypothetical protein
MRLEELHLDCASESPTTEAARNSGLYSIGKIICRDFESPSQLAPTQTDAGTRAGTIMTRSDPPPGPLTRGPLIMISRDSGGPSWCGRMPLTWSAPRGWLSKLELILEVQCAAHAGGATRRRPGPAAASLPPRRAVPHPPARAPPGPGQRRPHCRDGHRSAIMIRVRPVASESLPWQCSRGLHPASGAASLPRQCRWARNCDAGAIVRRSLSLGAPGARRPASVAAAARRPAPGAAAARL